ncbi:hypothetical protein EDC18_10185 [Natranaerovirga pectinivora]|uniref:Uncharacterized protein n=1 Tax=Natranaerovirga pectinivora TaxID=682400 RepID=A0A4V2V0K9_9FIRM|nr:hypothetical protein [Natranaerovirga pectinivora]TCT16789.1 hypothetical protein EDC18_10185 [Natranaerovirga pectinivora]
MNNSRYTYGFLLIIIGFYVLMNNFINISIGRGIPFIIASIILFVLYFNKKEKWLLSMSIIFLFLGLLRFVPTLPIIGVYLEDSIFYLFTGVVLMSLYFKRKGSFSLVLGSFLLWIGIGRVISVIPILVEINSGIFLISLGMAFLTIYLVRFKKWLLIPAGVLITLGVWHIIDYYYEFKLGNISISAIIIAFLLISIGINLLIGKDKKTNSDHKINNNMRNHNKIDDEIIIDLSDDDVQDK